MPMGLGINMGIYDAINALLRVREVHIIFFCSNYLMLRIHMIMVAPNKLTTPAIIKRYWYP